MIGCRDEKVDFRSQRFDNVDLDFDVVLLRRSFLVNQVLGSESEENAFPDIGLAAIRLATFRIELKTAFVDYDSASLLPYFGGHDIHGRRSYEAGYKPVDRIVVQLQRRADLLDRSVA